MSYVSKLLNIVALFYKKKWILVIKK